MAPVAFSVMVMGRPWIGMWYVCVPPPLRSARLRSWSVIAPAEERVVGVRVTIAVREWCVSGGRCGRVKAYFEAMEEAGVVWRWWGDKGGDWGGVWCRD